MELVQSLLSDEDYHIVGDVDLKKLAAMLPQTFAIVLGIYAWASLFWRL